jgi:hypothetical protein
MARRKAPAPEEIVSKLRQVEVLIGQGKTVAEAVRAKIFRSQAEFFEWVVANYGFFRRK